MPTHVNWTMGGTLVRVSAPIGMRPRKAHKLTLRYPTALQLRLGCDRCPSHRHSKQNALCSATLQVPSPFTEHGSIYHIHTGALVGALALGPVARKAHTLKATAVGSFTLAGQVAQPRPP